VGKYKSGLGSHACIACAACVSGSYRAGCSDTWLLGVSPGSCLPCPGGQYKTGVDSSTSCTPCEVCGPGLSREGCGGSGPGACLPCAAGKYKLASNTGGCLQCPPHTTSPAGSISYQECTCNAGYTMTDGLCEACSAGKYKATPGNDTCSQCPWHAVSPEGSRNISACQCDKGFTGPSASCAACPQVSCIGRVAVKWRMGGGSVVHEGLWRESLLMGCWVGYTTHGLEAKAQVVRARLLLHLLGRRAPTRMSWAARSAGSARRASTPQR